MDIEENNPRDLGKENPYIARGPSKARHDEASVSYLKPIIKELARTQVCFPNIKLLVDKISTVKVPSATDSSSLEAYLMYLTDREKTIQAVVKRRLHKWLTTFNVREGSYVILKEYSLAKGKRLNGEGEVFYLAISDFYSIGEEQRYRAGTGTELENISANAEGDCVGSLKLESVGDGNEGSKVEAIGAKPSPEERSAETYTDNDTSDHSNSSKVAIVDTRKRKRGVSALDLDPDLLSSTSKTDKGYKTPPAKMIQRQDHNHGQSRSSSDHVVGASASKVLLLPESVISPEHPPSSLQLSTLASITGSNASRNKQVNVLAMIDYVSSSTVKPTTAPLKRDVRIVDPSTDRKVTLSVFIDPVNFIPKQYDIILFRDLTTHDFSGGNLNAYPKKCRGKEWYIVDPYEFKECDMKSMEVFRARYRKSKAQDFG